MARLLGTDHGLYRTETDFADMIPVIERESGALELAVESSRDRPANGLSLPGTAPILTHQGRPGCPLRRHRRPSGWGDDWLAGAPGVDDHP